MGVGCLVFAVELTLWKFAGHFPWINSQQISTRFFCAELPKGPHNAKDITATQNTVNYCAVVFSLQHPDILQPGRFLPKKVPVNRQSWCLPRCDRDGKSQCDNKFTTTLPLSLSPFLSSLSLSLSLCSPLSLSPLSLSLPFPVLSLSLSLSPSLSLSSRSLSLSLSLYLSLSLSPLSLLSLSLYPLSLALSLSLLCPHSALRISIEKLRLLRRCRS